MLTEQVIFEKLRAIKPLLAEKFRVSSIGFFGSYANGNFTGKSDLDILIDFEQPVGWEFFNIQDILEEVLEVKVDLVTKKALRPQMRDTILKQTKYV